MIFPVICALGTEAVGQLPLLQPTMAEEKAGPFSYYLAPSDVVGFKDCPQGFQLTYDGALNNGFGEFQLVAGADLSPVNQRIRTLYKGRYPIPEFSFKRDGAVYRVQMWGAPKNLDPREDLIAYVRVTISNPSGVAVKAGLGAQYVARGTRNRAALPCREWYRDKFMDVRSWNGAASHEVGEVCAANGHAVFLVDEHLAGKVTDYEPVRTTVASKPVGATDRCPSTSVRFGLKPHSWCSVTFKVPFVPISLTNQKEIADLQGTSADAVFDQVVSFWKALFTRAASIDVPEQKVGDTFRASLAYMLIARDVLEDGKHFMQTVNKFQYHDFYFRDSAFFCRAYDMLGLPDIAAETVEYYLEKDSSGNPTDLKRIGEDDWGQSVWALAMHFRSTGDLDFARRIYPAFAPHMRYYHDRIAEDPLGIWPKLGPYDAELLQGHYTSHSFWTLLALRELANMANALGKDADRAQYMRLHDEYRGRFLAQLRKVTDLSGGYIPPGIDDPAAGRDWENATAGVYPFGILPLSDPRVAYTVRMVRDTRWREGISTWGTNAWVLQREIEAGRDPKPGTLHDYATYTVMETMLALGMQREVLEDLYSTLAHTSSTHAGFEMSTDPWGKRDTGGNYPPHGWFAARTVEFLRNSMVREDGDDLHLASLLSPVWLQPGKQVRVNKIATDFGTISFAIRSRTDGASVAISAKWRSAPRSMIFHVPWFLSIGSAEADGKPVEVSDGAIVLSPNARRLELQWAWTEKPDLSYKRAVELWLEKNYHPTPGMDKSFLFPRPARL